MKNFLEIYLQKLKNESALGIKKLPLSEEEGLLQTIQSFTLQ